MRADVATLARIAKLVALTASPNENEARTSAFVACKMMREHGIDIAQATAGSAEVARITEERDTARAACRATLRKGDELRQALSDVTESEGRYRATVTRLNAQVDGYRTMVSKGELEIEALRARVAELETGKAKRASGPRSDAKVADEAKPTKRRKTRKNAPQAPASAPAESPRRGGALRVLAARFPGRCAHCEASFAVGETIAWGKGRGSFHVACVDAQGRAA